MGWSKKYKKSIDCNNPKGFSQKAHCAGKRKKESKMSLKLEELVGKPITEAQFDEAAGKKDACYHKVKARYDVWPSAYASGALVKCRKVGAANWGNKSKKKEGVNEKALSWHKYFKGYNDKELKVISQFINLNKKGIDGVIKMSKEKEFKPMIKKIAQKGLHEAPDHDLAMKFKKVDDTILKLISRYKNKANVEAIVNSWMKGLHAKLKKQGIHEGLADRFKKNIDKYNKKAKKSKDYLKKLKKKESVEEAYDIWAEDGSFGYTMTGIVEAEYGGRKVKLGKPMQGDVKKFKVYVKNPKGNVVKVNFGHGGSSAKGKTMKIRKSNPKARANFRARHNCDNPGPRHKARYWSCRKW